MLKKITVTVKWDIFMRCKFLLILQEEFYFMKISASSGLVGRELLIVKFSSKAKINIL